MGTNTTINENNRTIRNSRINGNSQLNGNSRLKRNSQLNGNSRFNRNSRLNRTIKKNNPAKMVYSLEEYNSNDGMLTSIWGPNIWFYLHTISFNYPVNPTTKDKKHYRDFILNLENVLPCGKCRKNLCLNFKKLPLRMSDMKNRQTFSLYVYNLHEVINKMLHKKTNLTYNEVRERFEHFRARCLKNPPKTKSIHKERGCVESLYGEKSKCIIKIVPDDIKCDTIQIDKKCINHKIFPII
jgi:hypothetical protein